MRARRGEYCVFDEPRDGAPALEPHSQRGHGETDVFGDELDETIDVGELPRPEIALQELLHPGFGDAGLRLAGGGTDRSAGPRQQAVDGCRADVEYLADLCVSESQHIVQ